MKTLLIFAAAIFIAPEIFAQSIERQVISSFGFSYSGALIEMDCTVGEVVTATGQSATVDITQGFHQPFLGVAACPGDFDGNGAINVSDLLLFSGEFGCSISCGLPDLDDNGVVNVTDLLIFLPLFGTVCP